MYQQIRVILRSCQRVCFRDPSDSQIVFFFFFYGAELHSNSNGNILLNASAWHGMTDKQLADYVILFS